MALSEVFASVTELLFHPFIQIAAFLLVTALSYLLGVRITKERADRALLRTTYTELYNHFRDMKEALDSGRPKTWSDYEKEHRRYWPVARDMERNGTLNLLPSRLVDHILQAEKDALLELFQFYDHLEKQLIPEIKSYIESRLCNLRKPVAGEKYVEVHIDALCLYSDTDLNNLLCRLRENVDGFSVEFAMKHGKTDAIYIFPDEIGTTEKPLAEFLQEIVDTINNDPKACENAASMRKVAQNLTSVMEILAKRIREPHPLWETLCGIKLELLGDKGRRDSGRSG